jgi:thiol:disulfide interchange protein DsbA
VAHARRSALRLIAGGFACVAGIFTTRTLAQVQRSFEESFRAITPQPTPAGDKIEVIDFFWYRCPYCYELLPLILEWEKTKPADVVLRRIPAVLRQDWVPDAHLYYTLDMLGMADQLHAKVFEAVHRDRMLVTDREGWGKWAVANGIERDKWDAAYNDREVRDRVVRAVDIARDYDVRGTPAIVVDGRYQTGSGQAGSLKNVMPTVDGLIKLTRERRSGKA